MNMRNPETNRIAQLIINHCNTRIGQLTSLPLQTEDKKMALRYNDIIAHLILSHSFSTIMDLATTLQKRLADNLKEPDNQLIDMLRELEKHA